MKLLSKRSLFAISLSAVLAACGGSSPDTEAPFQTASLVHTVDVSAPQGGQGQPQPDCAPEGCNSLRIIDGNAEAYRLDAMRRAGQQDDEPQA